MTAVPPPAAGPAGHPLGAERVRQLPAGGLAGLLMEATGGDVVNLAVGTPGWPATPPELVKQAVHALQEGVHQYEDPAGNTRLREWIAHSLPGRPDPRTELTVTAGASEALAVALLACVDPGDEVIVLEPFYENFLSAIALAGGVPRVVSADGPGWAPDPAALTAAFGPRTRAIVINSPSNPTGRLLTGEELGLIAELCARWDVVAVSDEVYASYVYDGAPHRSAAEVPGLADRSIVLGSFSKSHSVSGWRLGYMRAPEPWTRLLRQVHVATTGGAASPLQHALAHGGPALADGWDPAGSMRPLRDHAVRMLTAAGFDCAVPEGGVYVMAGIGGLTRAPSPRFVRELAQRTGVLLAPATPFFAEGRRGTRYVRVAFNRPEATLLEAHRRLNGGPAPSAKQRSTFP
ncbi:pyridoxal phosphate-dependent aminotransferase [Streptomyces sp. NBRC 110028]|uniref:pyridoxal phosphate-dependent aminotransferase n=1 Tax=Streptomyces sp. NBRC 110028 TaxID=1621260 RepID=UPI0006E4468B|nr:pyridoxal phosphate-dependent aminotransferase [Streptomyces sp. NBRC 110028]